MKKKNHNDPNPKYKFKKCDDPFEDAKVEAMKARKKGFFVRQAMYWGVVLAGRRSYKTGPKRFEIREI